MYSSLYTYVFMYVFIEKKNNKRIIAAQTKTKNKKSYFYKKQK